MAKINDLLAQLGPGWSLVGAGVPVEETTTVANPMASNPAPPKGADLSPTIQAGTGQYYVVVQDPQGHQRAMFLSPTPLEGGVVVPVTGRTPPAGTTAFNGDLRTLDWNPGKPVSDVPAAPAGPAKPAPTRTSPNDVVWVDIQGPLQSGQPQMQQGFTIIDNQLVPIPGHTQVKPADDKSTAPTWIVDPNDDKREIQVVYQGTKGIPLTYGGVVVSRPKQKAAGEGSQTAGGPHWVPKEGDDTQEIEVVTTTENGVVTNKPTGATRKKPPPEPTAASQLVYQDIEGQPGKQQGGLIVDGQFVPVPGQIKDKDQKPVAVYGTGPNDEFLMVLDDKGQIVSQSRNPNYKQQPGTQLTPDTVSEFIQILKPDGTVQSVKNTNRITVGEAMANLMQQAGLKVNAGQMSMDDAKNMLTGAVNLMNAQTAQQTAATGQQAQMTSTANTVLDATSRNATTGGNLLSNRATAAQGALGQVLGLAGQGQRSGNMGGGLMSVPAGLGEGLVGGITNWTRDMFGGDETLASAARLVQQADPASGQGQNSALAFGVLGQMLQKYKELNGGKPHPSDASSTAAAASGQANGVVAPAATGGGQSYWEQLRAQAAASQAANPLPTPNPAPNLGTAQGFQQLAPWFTAPAGLPPGAAAPSFSQPFPGQWPTFVAPPALTVR